MHSEAAAQLGPNPLRWKMRKGQVAGIDGMRGRGKATIMKLAWDSGFSHEGDLKASLVRRTAVLPEKAALPGPEGKVSPDHRYRFTCPGKGHFDVTGHVIRSLKGMGEKRILLRNLSFKPGLQIFSRAWISVFHNDKAAAGVAAKDHHESINETGILQNLLKVRG